MSRPRERQRTPQAHTTPRSRTRYRAIAVCIALVSAGFLVSGYLLLRSWTLLVEHDHDAIDVCQKLFRYDCDTTLMSTSSWFLEVPLAGWGLVYYASLASLLTLALAVGRAFEQRMLLGALGLAIIAALASVALALTIASGHAAFCPLCVFIHIINVALVPVLWASSGRTWSQHNAALRAAGSWLLRGESDDVESRWTVVGFVTMVLVAIVLYQWVLVQTERRFAVDAFDATQELAAYAATPRQAIPLPPTDARMGSPEAAVEMVVFSSFRCPGCRVLAGELGNLKERFGEQLAIVFKHFPVVEVCELDDSARPRACDAAWAAEAARRQGRFWEFHDALFATGVEASEEEIRGAAREAQLDIDRFEVDRRSPETIEKVNADCRLATMLGIKETPTVFINERRVKQISRRVLELLIASERGVDPGTSE